MPGSEIAPLHALVRKSRQAKVIHMVETYTVQPRDGGWYQIAHKLTKIKGYTIDWHELRKLNPTCKLRGDGTEVIVLPLRPIPYTGPVTVTVPDGGAIEMPEEVIPPAAHLIFEGLGLIYEFAAWTEAGEAAGALGELVAPVIDTIFLLLSLPASWAVADRLAKFNGECMGYWGAMQDLADAFSDDSLDHKPIADWPEIPTPKPALPPGTASDRMEDVMWRNGQSMGCALATKLIETMEKTPRTLTFKNKSGEKRTIKLTGKLYLRGLFRSTNGRVAGAIAEKIDKKLAEKFDGQEWPLHRI